MKGFFRVTFAVSCFLSVMLLPLTSLAGEVGVEQILKALSAVECYRSKAEFTVTMPQLSEDVVYNLDLESKATNGADPLLPCDYLIDWELTGRQEPVKGFSAYFTGHHYRFSGEKLQEYHMEWDSVPFIPNRYGLSRGVSVQRAAQFVNLLPQVMADELAELLADSLSRVVYHPDTLIGGEHRRAIDIDVVVGGTIGRECEYVFDYTTLMPIRVTFENSPGSIAEQTVEIKYTPLNAPCMEINEKGLMDRYTTAFEEYRQSNFSIESMRGKRLPGFSVPTTTGERYSRRAGDPFRTPTILALLEPGGGFNPQLVETVRKITDQLPYDADVIWAFTGNNLDIIEETIPSVRPGETLLKSARSLARDCGAADLPAILLIGSDGVVKNVIIGFNKTLYNDVLQEMNVLR